MEMRPKASQTKPKYMQFPSEYKYSKEHKWLKLLGNNQELIGITEFAQSELGAIVYVNLPQVGKQFKKDKVFGFC